MFPGQNKTNSHTENKIVRVTWDQYWSQVTLTLQFSMQPLILCSYLLLSFMVLRRVGVTSTFG